MSAIHDLWGRLGPELRRRVPKHSEVPLVSRLVLTACVSGAHAKEALRVTGLAPEQFLKAIGEVERSVLGQIMLDLSEG